MKYYQIDEKGIIIGCVSFEPKEIIDEEGIVIGVEEEVIDEKVFISKLYDGGLHIPMWNGSEWVEGGVKQAPLPLTPTLDERVLKVEQDNADIITILSEIVGL